MHHVFWLKWLTHPALVEKLNHCRSSLKMYSTHHMTMVVFLSFFQSLIYLTSGIYSPALSLQKLFVADVKSLA